MIIHDAEYSLNLLSVKYYCQINKTRNEITRNKNQK
jgi:hypothetical protein